MAVTDPNVLWGQAGSDPTVVAGKGGLRQALINAYLNFGDPSSLFAANGTIDPATGQPVSYASLYGIDQNAVSGAATNPYSTLNQLGQQARQTTEATNSNLAGRNLEFSGSAAAHAQANAQADQLRRYQATQGLSGTLQGIGTQYGSLISGAYTNLMNNALNDPTIPQQTQTPAGLPTPAPVGLTPATQTWQTNPGGFNAGAPQNQPGIAPPVLPKAKTPKPKSIVGIPHA